MGCGRYQFDAQLDAAVGDVVDVADAADPGLDAFVCLTTFCDRFDDRTTDVMGGWDDVFTTGGGTSMISGGTYVVTLNATSDAVFLEETIPAATSTITFGAKIGWATSDVGTDCELDLVALQWLSGGCASPYGFYLVRDGTGPFNVQETNGNAGCNGNRNNNLSNLDNTGLHDVKLVVVVGAVGIAKTTLYLDGTLVHDRLTLQPVPSAPFLLRLGGVIVRNAAAAWTITYEDVYVDVN